MLRAYDVHVLYESRNLDSPTLDVRTDNSQARSSLPSKIPLQNSDSSLNSCMPDQFLRIIDVDIFEAVLSIPRFSI